MCQGSISIVDDADGQVRPDRWTRCRCQRYDAWRTVVPSPEKAVKRRVVFRRATVRDALARHPARPTHSVVHNT